MPGKDPKVLALGEDKDGRGGDVNTKKPLASLFSTRRGHTVHTGPLNVSQ